MGRTKGTYSLTSNIEPKFGAPLDARTIVKLKTDLTASGTFDYPYIGLTVFVEEENKKYTLIGANPTVASNWMEETASGAAADITYDNTTSQLESTNVQGAIDEVVAGLGTAAYKDVPASGDAGFNQVVLGKDTRLTYYDRNRYDAQVKCSTNIVEGNIIVGINGLYHHLNDGTVFDITYPILYANNNMGAGAANKSNYDSLAIDITITQQMTLTQFLPVYIKGRLSGIMFNPISTTPLTQEMVHDGYHYMLLGLASTSTKIYLFHDHRIFADNGGSFCEIVGNLGTAAYRDISPSGNASIYQVVTGGDTRLSDARPASDVSAWAKASTKPTYTASEVDAIATTAKGSVNGVAELDSAGKVPSSQLPSFVDDVIEVADHDHLPITGESGKIYVTIDTNKTYRWTGSGYAEISESLALGETSSTAYRGDRGKAAYDHASETKLSTATASGLYKVASTAQGHIASLTAVQKSDITGLGIPAQDTTYGVVSKTANGLAPQLPNETTTTKYLRQDGTWQVPPDNDTKNTAGSTNSTSKLFLVGATEQSANPQTYSYSGVYATNGTLTASNAQAVLIGVNSNTGTTGGISLYNGTGNSDNYGIMFRKVSNKGTHGYMQDTNNWATYFTMFLDGTASRGWIFNNKNVGNIASINTAGNAVFNGSVTIGGNATNTSGARMEYNSSTQAIDFVFV
jgi:hypothetical protein